MWEASFLNFSSSGLVARLLGVSKRVSRCRGRTPKARVDAGFGHTDACRQAMCVCVCNTYTCHMSGAGADVSPLQSSRMHGSHRKGSRSCAWILCTECTLRSADPYTRCYNWCDFSPSLQERAVQQGRAMAQRGALSGREVGQGQQGRSREGEQRPSDSGSGSASGSLDEQPTEGREREEEEEEEEEERQMRDRWERKGGSRARRIRVLSCSLRLLSVGGLVGYGADDRFLRPSADI